MFTRWKKGIDEDDSGEWAAQVSSAMPVMKRLISMLEEDLASVETAMKKRSAYNNPSWPYYHADLLGEQRGYNKALLLMKNLYGEEHS